METIEALKNEIGAWAVERGQEHVAIEISRMWFLLGGGTGRVRLYPIEDEAGLADWKAIYNNRQQIFRYLRSDSKAARAKLQELAGAMHASLPAERRAHISDDPTNYMISTLLRDVSAIVTAVLMNDRHAVHYIRAAHSDLNAILHYVTK